MHYSIKSPKCAKMTNVQIYFMNMYYIVFKVIRLNYKRVVHL